MGSAALSRNGKPRLQAGLRPSGGPARLLGSGAVGAPQGRSARAATHDRRGPRAEAGPERRDERRRQVAVRKAVGPHGYAERLGERVRRAPSLLQHMQRPGPELVGAPAVQVLALDEVAVALVLQAG